MDIRLIEAAHKGDVHQLKHLIEDDPFLLKAVALLGGETPLHIACMAGSLSFVKELLNLRPEFTKDLSTEGFSPLHIAAANGDLEIVKELLKIGDSLSLVKGKEGRIPLHYAVVKGRIQVIKEMISASEDSIREVTARGETFLHLAAKNNQFEALKSLAVYLKTHDKEDILNENDAQGNTILHLAASRKQYEVVELVLDENFVNKGKLELNSLNKRGLTPLDVLLSEGGDGEIEQMLRLAGASGVEDMHLDQQAMQTENGTIATQDSSAHGLRSERPPKPSKKLQEYFKYDKTKDSPSKVRNILLVVAVLIATATYQAVLNPPGGVWQDDFWSTSNTTTINDATKPPAHTAGKAVMGTKNIVSFSLFLLFNSIGFFMSVHMLYFLTINFPLQLELQVSLFALVATYDTCMGAIAPNGKLSLFFVILSIVMPLLMMILTKVVRDYPTRRRCVYPNTRATA